MADKTTMDDIIDHLKFSEVEADDVFTEAFVDKLFPELTKDPSFNEMRETLSDSKTLWGTTRIPAMGNLQAAANELLETIQKAKSQPKSLSEQDKKAILGGYKKVFHEYSTVVQAATAQTRADSSKIKKEAVMIDVESKNVKREAQKVVAEQRAFEKAQKEYEKAQQQVAKKQQKAAKDISAEMEKTPHSPIFPNSKIMPDKMRPREKGIDFEKPFISKNTERTVVSGYKESQIIKKTKQKAGYPTLEAYKKFKNQKTSSKILPFPVNAADHARGIEYDIQGDEKSKAGLQKMFPGEFKSGSKTGSVPRNARKEQTEKRGRSPASEYGTAMHALFEMMDKGGMSINDILQKSKQFAKDPILGPAFNAKGGLRPSALSALKERKKILDSGDETTLFNEVGVGGIVKVNGENQKRTATIDRLYRNNKTGEIILEDYKNEKYPKIFEHVMQLAAEAALLNADQANLKDNKGNPIEFGGPVTKGRVAVYNPTNGTQSFMHYDLGTTEDYLKYLPLQEKLNAAKADLDSGKITKKDYDKEEIEFFKKLPSVFQKAYADQFGPIRKRVIGDADSNGANWLEIQTPNGEYSSILFNEQGNPKATNTLFDLWKTDPDLFLKTIQNTFNSSLVPAEYKRELYWKAYNLKSAIFDKDVDVDPIREFAGLIESTGNSAQIKYDWNDPNIRERAELRARRREEKEGYRKDNDISLLLKELDSLSKDDPRRSEVEDKLNQIYKSWDWFIPDTSDRSRKGLGTDELALPNPKDNNWDETRSVIDSLKTSSHYYPALMGEKIKSLITLLNEYEEYAAKGSEGRDTFNKKLRELQLSMLGEMTPEDLQLFQKTLGNDSESISAAQSKYNNLEYEVQAEGLNVDSEEFDDIIAENFNDSAANNLFGQYLRFRKRLERGYFPQEFTDKERNLVIKSFDKLLFPKNENAIDLVGTLTGGMARMAAGQQIYDELSSSGYKLTEEQERERAFGSLINEALKKQASSKKEISATDFFMNFGNDLISQYSVQNERGESELDREALKSAYGDYGYQWAARFAKMARNPSLYSDEIEQRMAEAFRRSLTTGNRVAYDRFGYKNKGEGVPHQGLTGRFLMAHGIPLSALRYERSEYYENATEDELNEILDHTEKEIDEWGIEKSDRGEWKLFDPDQLDAYKEAAKAYEDKEEIQDKIKEEVVEEVKEEVDRAIETEVKPIVEEVKKTEAIKDDNGDIERKTEENINGSKRKEASSSGSKKSSSRSKNNFVGGGVKVEGSPVTVNGSPVNVNGSPVTVNNNDGIVYNTGNAPITQNIIASGNVVVNGGDGQSGQSGDAGSLNFSSGSKPYLPPAIAEYARAKKQENDILNKINAEEIAIVGLDKEKNSKQKRERSRRLKEYKEELSGIRAEIDGIRDGAKEISDTDFKNIDDLYARYEKERSGKLNLARAIAKDKIGAKNEKEDIQGWRTYNSLLKQRSDILKTMMTDERRADLSIFGGEKEQIQISNSLRAESIELLDNEMAKMRKNGSISKKDAEELEKKYQRINKLNEADVNKQNRGAANLWENMGNQIKSLFHRFTQMDGVYRILGKIRQGITKVIQSAQQLDKVMTNLRIVTGYSAEDARALMNNYADLADQLSSTTAEVASAAQEWLRQGYQVSEVNSLVASSIQLSVLGMMSASDATKSLTSAMKGFKMEAGDVSKIVDKFTSLDMKAATSAGDIATALSKFATTAQMAGLNIDQASAMATTIMDVSQSDAGSTGNAIKTILSRYGNVKSGVFTKVGAGDSDDTTEKINDIEKVLSVIGIRIRDTAHEMRDFDDVLADIAKRWDNLDKVSQNAIATALAGTRQREAFAVLMNNYDKYRDFLEVSETSEGTAAKKYQSYTEQLEASQKRLQTAWEDLAQNTDVASFFKTVNNGLTMIVKNLPIILRLLVRAASITNAYKLPSLLSSIDPRGRFGNILSAFTTSGQMRLISQYNGSQNSKVGLLERTTSKFGLDLTTASKAVENFTASLNQSSATMRGKSAGASTKQSSYLGFAEYQKKKAKINASIRKKEKEIRTFDALKKKRQLEEERNLQYYGEYGIYNSQLQDDDSDLEFENRRTDFQRDLSKLKELKKRKTNLKKRRLNSIKSGIKTGGALRGMAGFASGALTATTTGHDVFGTGKQFELTTDQQAYSRISTGVVQGVLSAINPLAGMLGGVFMDILNKFFVLPLMNREKLDREQRMEIAQKTFDLIKDITNDSKELKDLAARSFSPENYEAERNAVNSILGKMYTEENTKTRRLLENRLTNILGSQKSMIGEQVSLNDVMQDYLAGDAQEKKRIALALEIAENQIAASAKYDTLEGKRAELEERLSRKSLGETWGIAGFPGFTNPITALASYAGQGQDENLFRYNNDVFDLTQAYREIGLGDYVHKQASDHGMGGWGAFLEGLMRFASMGYAASEQTYLDTSNLSLDEQIALFSKARDEAYARGAEDHNFAKLAQSAENILIELKDIKAQQEQIYEEMNQNYVKSAFLEASVGTDALGNKRYLTSATTRELKGIGIEGIRELIAKELVASGGLMGHETYTSEGKLTDYAKKEIDSYLKTTNFASIVTASAYSIREAAVMPEGEAKEQFITTLGNALFMSEDEVRRQLADKSSPLFEEFGDLTLGFLTETTAETRTHINDLTSLFDSLTSSMGLTAENIETIIEKMPNLVKYLGDEGGMVGAIIKDLDAYKRSYAIKTTRSILSTTGVFDEFDANLRSQIGEDKYAELVSSKTEAGKIYGGASKLEDILELISGDASALGIDPEVQKQIQKNYEELFANIDTDKIVDQKIAQTMIQYQTKAYDKQIKNLNEQKQALQDINKQREYENKLIEARNKLEEASKERKRIWREGIGWVYEADQEAIEEAQKNLESVQNEKKIDDLQLSIDYLEAERDFLNDIASEAEFKRLETAYKEWATKNNLILSNQRTIIKDISDLYNGKKKDKDAGTTAGDASKDAVSQSEEQKAKAEKAAAGLGSSWETLKKAREDLNSTDELSPERQAREEAYDKALADFKNTTTASSGSEGYENFFNSNAQAKDALSWKEASKRYLTFFFDTGFKKFKAVVDLERNVPDKAQGNIIRAWKQGHGHWLNIGGNGNTVSAINANPVDSDVFTSESNGSLTQWMNSQNGAENYLLTSGDANSLAYVYGHQLHPVSLSEAEHGSLRMPGGISLVNEKGTEAIITPQGTLTSLPSGSGVVPADITRNLWSLGEIAPQMLRYLERTMQGDIYGHGAFGQTDESLNIGVFNMNVTPQGDFDVDSWVNQIKQAVASKRGSR